ncbi:PREDICTED: uncharacterized protein LOC109590633 [Amphimedon queenslandica]|uniref:Uncharacterized protein n=1 Tax=Amphimedon queenslandica TaxID=400682 RepID=A0AAN0JYN3_AMPQE|nr:PREDICTED: uncharacterized protein LOC109590633 [Amphimedon queenslandica]|eukprot:XP_019862091.1 PREDICTED: uncharacterized protein LOC109590633 [Amphimedon queenslandica]
MCPSLLNSPLSPSLSSPGNGSYTFSTSSLPPGYYTFRLEAHDQYGYTYSIVSVFTVQPIDRICCPVILWGNANVSNSTSASSTSTQSSSNGVRTVRFSTDISTGNCSLTEGFSYTMSWSSQTVQSGSVPLHHTSMNFSMPFTGRGNHTISFSYCNNPTTRSNVCCDKLSLTLSLS